MTITYYDNDVIKKDNNIVGDCKTYLTNGQGCQTIWFKSMGSARKAYQKDGVKIGCDLFDCEKCACHYSNINPKQAQFPFHACNKEKEKYAAQF